MKRYWELACSRIEGLSLRERTMTFLAAAFVTVALINTIAIDPFLARQKGLSAQAVQQQEKMKELQAGVQMLVQAKRDDERSPLRVRVAQLRQQLQEQDAYLQSRQERLVEPQKMAGLLEQVLKKNGQLQLIELKNLPASPLVENAGQKQPDTQKQVFKHGIQIVVRGSYLDLLRYLEVLEKMPAQMFWGEASLEVDKYPDALLTLTLYTLSLDKTWLTV